MTGPALFDRVRAIALRLPEVEEGTTYGTASLRVRGKFFSRIREDGETLVLKTDFETQDFLLQAYPDIYYITDHYKGYPYILVRLSAVGADELREQVERAWRLTAPKKLVAQYDQDWSRP
ncbi:MmcQ/YjbR family DNA-binding protein [Paenibacillus sp. GCM10012303]|uniref:MmcQ/YjbR family DNA-binding protein n=1 Tax=Paenibacillus sp. GCM10012303 TaxID=3317340 RepID=UPI0036202847